MDSVYVSYSVSGGPRMDSTQYYDVERKMNCELDLTHGKAKWTHGHMLKVEVDTNSSIWILDSFGVMLK